MTYQNGTGSCSSKRLIIANTFLSLNDKLLLNNTSANNNRQQCKQFLVHMISQTNLEPTKET